MSTLTPDELARLRLKAKHGTLTPEEQRAYNDYATEQLSAVPSRPRVLYRLRRVSNGKARRLRSGV